MRSVDRWLFAPGDARRLAGLRIALFTILALRLSRTLYEGLAGQPAALFRPISFMHLFVAMPPLPWVVLLQILGIAAAFASIIGFRARVAMPVALVCGLVLNGMATSLGVIVHNDSLLLLCLVPLTFSACDEAWAVDHGNPSDPSPRFGWPVRTAMVLCVGAYFFAGFGKLVLSGPAWITSGSLRWILYQFSRPGGTRSVGLLIADRAWLAHGVAAFSVGVELGFPVVLIKPRLTPVFVSAVVLLHTGIWVTMGLDYWAQAATVVAVFVDWSGVVGAISARHVGTEGPATLFYDEDCGLCRRVVGNMTSRAGGRLRSVPLQDPSAAGLLGAVEEGRLLESWHLRSADGKVLSGGDVVPEMLEYLPGRVVTVPVARRLRWIIRPLYRLAARHRDVLGRVVGAPRCSVHDSVSDGRGP